MRSQAKIFVLGAFRGAVFGATVLASIAHLLLIGLALVGVGALVYRGRRRLVTRAGREERRVNS